MVEKQTTQCFKCGAPSVRDFCAGENAIQGGVELGVCAKCEDDYKKMLPKNSGIKAINTLLFLSFIEIDSFDIAFKSIIGISADAKEKGTEKSKEKVKEIAIGLIGATVMGLVDSLSRMVAIYGQFNKMDLNKFYSEVKAVSDIFADLTIKNFTQMLQYQHELLHGENCGQDELGDCDTCKNETKEKTNSKVIKFPGNKTIN